MRSQTRSCTPRLPRPDMAPFASLFLVVGCFFLLTSTLKEPPKGLISLEETPHMVGNDCFNVADYTQVLVCLTTSGRLSLAVCEPGLQRAVLDKVGKKYGVHFSPAVLASLGSATFIAVRLENISAAIVASASSVSASHEFSNTFNLPETQLLDCVESARTLSPKFTGQPSGIYLSIDAQTRASLVMRLVSLFQRRGIYRLYLLTHHS
jgi:hypothetical protein